MRKATKNFKSVLFMALRKYCIFDVDRQLPLGECHMFELKINSHSEIWQT